MGRYRPGRRSSRPAVPADPALAAAGVGTAAAAGLTLSSILTDSEKITGMVDWGEFRLGSRALDLIALALDCQQRGAHATADRLLAQGGIGRGQRGPALPCAARARPVRVLCAVLAGGGRVRI